MTNELSVDRDALLQRLAAYGLRVPEADISGLQTMLADIEASSRALQKSRSYELEPMGVFRLKRP